MVNIVIKTVGLTVYYGGRKVLEDVNVDIFENSISAVIGPSGTGKSSFLRSLNRLNDLIPGAKVVGEVYYRGKNIYDEGVNVYLIRTRIGMVFQRPTIFPMSIYENVAFGLRINNVKDEDVIYKRVRNALVMAALWDEVKDRLEESAYNLSTGQQQRLCLARTLAIEPDVLLLDEPTSYLDPKSTKKIEDVLLKLKNSYTIIIVTHSLSQARRISDYVLVFMPDDDNVGKLIEYGPSPQVLNSPVDPKTREYVEGLIG
ncbi:MAG TPA: phosphate ABC transporter ATP-binding protein [Thermoprotei archaeon]|nr:phosphate ABC transporter ATP-binding protein [Thermoprotei archaeon]